MLLKLRVVPPRRFAIEPVQCGWKYTSGLQTPEPSLRFPHANIRLTVCMQRVLPIVVILLVGCDHGLEPPGEPITGAIRAEITYFGQWPPQDSVRDLRFVAMRFVPTDTSDFLQLNRLVFSDRLEYGVEAQALTMEGVEAGPFLYAGVAQQYGSDALDWKPVGIVAENDGVFIVRQDETTHVSVEVDFQDPPPFPPRSEP